MSIGTWFAQEETKVAAWFSNEEAALVKYFGPLFKQILAQAVIIGKGDAAAGLTVLQDAVTSAVAAGAAAAVSGGNAVQAAENALISTGTSEGITAVHNAEAGLIKAGVAIAQETAAAASTAIGGAVASLTPTTTP